MDERVLVDVDDVIIDLMPSWLRLYNESYEDDLKKEDIVSWEISDYVKLECGEKILDFLENPKIYDQADEVPGAIDGLSTMVLEGYDVWLLTARYSSAKNNWLHKNGVFDIVPVKQFLVTPKKDLIRGDVMIDDYDQNIKKFSGYGILFDQPWNRNYDHPHRAKGWEDVLELLIEYRGNGKEIIIPGMGKDVPIEVNEIGGSQSKIDYSFDLIEPQVLFKLANVLATGAEKHGVDNWKKIPIRKNLNHAIAHIYAWLAGDRQDTHLTNALCRLHFAVWQEINSENK